MLKKIKTRYALIGIIFGLIFPILATILDMLMDKLPFSLTGIMDLHIHQPLHLIIDFAPIILGAAGWFLGKQQLAIVELSDSLEVDLDNFYRLTSDMLFIADFGGRLHKVNPAFETFFEASEKDVIGLTLNDLLFPEDIEKADVELSKIVQGKEVRKVQLRVKSKSGLLKWISISANPFGGNKIYAIGREVTEDKEKEESLYQESQINQAILDSANFTIISTDLKGVIQTFNSTAEKFLQYSAEEVIGLNPPPQLHNAKEFQKRANELSAELGRDIQPNILAMAAKAKETGEPDEQEWNYFRKDGTHFPAIISVTVLKNKLGEITGYLGIGKDISQIKMYEKELQENEQRLKQFLDAVPIGIYVIGADGKPYYANTRSTELLGKGISPNIDIKEIAETYDAFEEGTRNPYPIGNMPIVKALKGESTTINDMEINRNGERILIEVQGKPIYDSNKKLIFALAAFSNITARKKAEIEIQRSRKFLDSVVQNIPTMLFVKDAKDLRFVRFNRAGEELIGFKEADLLGKNDYDLFPKEQADFFTSKDREVFNRKELTDIAEEPIDTKKGERILHTKKVPLFDEQGNPQFLLGISEDITDQIKRKDELERSNKELDQFAYVVSHDLKAPLRAISNLAVWVEEDIGDNLTDELSNHLRLMRNRVSRMENLIQGLLEYSRIGRVPGESETIQVETMLNNILDLFRLEAKGFEFVLTCSFPKVKSKKFRLQQVFTNLIENAIKYHPSDHGKIEISCEEKGDSYIFSVKDDGHGIEEQYHDKIFEVFQRLEARDDVEGTGIGLSIVKKIVEDHGGKVRIESKMGEGSTFFFSWPK